MGFYFFFQRLSPAHAYRYNDPIGRRRFQCRSSLSNEYLSCTLVGLQHCWRRVRLFLILVLVVGCRNTSTNYRETGILDHPGHARSGWAALRRTYEPPRRAESGSAHKRASRLHLIKLDLQPTKNLLAYALHCTLSRAYCQIFETLVNSTSH